MQAVHVKLGLIALAAFLVHLLAATTLGFHRDELLYLSQAARPAFGYLSVPPLTAWFGAAWTSVFGESLLAVRALPAVYGLAFLVLVERHVVAFGGGDYARVLAAVAVVVTPLSLRAFGLYQPVGLDLVLWAAVSLASLRLARRPSLRAALTLGVLVGLGLLNKYLILLWIGGLLLGLSLTPHRQQLWRWPTAVAAAAALLVWSPNLVWQWTHGWPVFTHLGELADSQLVHVSRFDILTEQALILLTAFPLALWGGVWLWRRPDYRYLPLAALVVAVALVVLQGKSYYLAGVHAPLLAAGCVALAGLDPSRWVKAVVWVGLVLPPLALLPLGVPVAKAPWLVAYFDQLEHSFGLEVGRTDERGEKQALPQDYADMLGWAALGDAAVFLVDSLTRSAELSPPQVVVYAENYGQAGAVDLAFRQNQLAMSPLSFNESWLYWSPADLSSDVRAFVYINDEIGEDVRSSFAEIRVAYTITNPYARERGTSVYLCQTPRRPVRELWTTARAGRTGF